MATYYVDPVNGNNSNNGLGPDASHATNKPWLTLAKALGAAGIASGDTVYLAPGTYREAVTIAMTSPVAETQVIGDPMNSRGFKTSGGVLVAPGDVRWTAYTTSDVAAPSSAPVVLNGRDFLTFDRIVFIGGSGSCVDSTVTSSTNCKFQRCVFKGMAAAAVIPLTLAVDVAAAWTISDCIFLGAGIFALSAPRPSAADLNLNITIQNCVSIGNIIGFTVSGANTFKWGGINFYNCYVRSSGGNMFTTVANMSTTFPVNVYNCVLYGSASTCFNANASGQIIEDYNTVIAFSVARTNTSTGTHSKTYPPLIEIGEAVFMGRLQRPFGQPTSGSPLLGFGAQAGGPATDLLGRTRPDGGSSALYAIGPLERGNTFIRDTSPIGGGGTAIKCTGPAYAEFLVPVPASAITISCVVKWDATYAGTKPQLQIDAQGTIGVAAETKTATGSSGSNETLTLSAFTPTAAGYMVVVRVLSNDTNGGGVLQVDNFSVTT